MIYRTMSRAEALLKFNQFAQNGIPANISSSLSRDYVIMRDDIKRMWSQAKLNKGEYKVDLDFALLIYEYFNKLPSITLPVLEDIEFWIYICMNVVPDIVFERHGLVEEYFYKKSGRIYLQALWTYIHMSYQGTVEDTREALSRLSTDYIMQFCERTGRDGYYLSVYREIVRVLSILPIDVINKSINGANLCRRVMMQNTAKSESFDLTFDSKEKEYVSMLFKECGVEVSDYE